MARRKSRSRRVLYEVRHIHSLAQLNEFASKHNREGYEVLYRGQVSDWKLVPGLERVRVDPEDREVVERRMFDEFVRTAVGFIAIPEDRWEALAVAQHYGLPTRLLDWTDSILTAAYFAVQSPARGQRPGVIWVFTPIEELFLPAESREDPFAIKQPWVFRPRHFAPRVRAQGGYFTAHPKDSRHRFTPFEVDDEWWFRMVKLVIAPKHFSDIRWDLDSAGIHAGSLVPELAGLGQRIRETNVRMTDE